MGEPLLRKLYEAGVRDLIVRPASGGDYVPATKGLRVRLPNGQQVGAIAQTDINGPVLSMLITQDGRGLVWCETAGKTINARTPELVRSRPQEETVITPPTGCLLVFARASFGSPLAGYWVSSSKMTKPVKVRGLLSDLVANGVQFVGDAKGNWVAAFMTRVLGGSFPNFTYTFTTYLYIGDATGSFSEHTFTEVRSNNPSGSIHGMSYPYVATRVQEFASTPSWKLYNLNNVESTGLGGGVWVTPAFRLSQAPADGVWQNGLTADGIFANKKFLTASGELSYTNNGFGLPQPEGVYTSWDSSNNVFKTGAVNFTDGTTIVEAGTWDRDSLTLSSNPSGNLTDVAFAPFGSAFDSASWTRHATHYMTP